MIIKERFNQKLLVEGNDDQHVIWSLCERFSIAENFDVVECGGVNRLLEQIPVRFKQSGIKTIGVIIDADVDMNSRWKSLSELLAKEHYTVPAQLPGNGLVLNPASMVKVGIWVMPDNKVNGMIEDFIRFLVPNNDSLLMVATETLDKIESKELNKYSLSHKSKALIHTWLSWQEDPGTPMGLAITKKYLTTEKEICSALIQWIKTTFTT